MECKELFAMDGGGFASSVKTQAADCGGCQAVLSVDAAGHGGPWAEGLRCMMSRGEPVQPQEWICVLFAVRHPPASSSRHAGGGLAAFVIGDAPHVGALWRAHDLLLTQILSVPLLTRHCSTRTRSYISSARVQ